MKFDESKMSFWQRLLLNFVAMGICFGVIYGLYFLLTR